MSALTPTVQAIYTRLRAVSGVTDLLAESVIDDDAGKAVYDMPPQIAAPESASYYPYVVLGDGTAAPFDTDDTDGMEHTQDVHVWDRAHGKKRVRQIMDAIYAALHKHALAVSGHYTILCYFDFATMVPDEDGATQHGVIRFRIVTQDT